MSQTCGMGKKKKVYSYYICPKCGKRVSESRIIDSKHFQLQKITNEYFAEDAGYFDKKKAIAKLRDKQKQLVEKTKRQVLDVDTFYELYISYNQEIDSLQNKLDKIAIKSSIFSELDNSFKKEIISKYIKEVKVEFLKKSYITQLVLY